MTQKIRRTLRQAFPKYALYWSAINSLLTNEDSYLYTTGWMRSLRESKPVDKDGREVPWMCYPVIRFLENRLHKGLDLFEFGSGHSTLFYARLVRSVTSVEYDEAWIQTVSARAPDNVSLIFRKRDEDGEYCRSIRSTGQRFDVVVVDGRDRVNCIGQSMDALTTAGVIVLDDSQRQIYAEGIDYARAKGFRALDFEGLKPTGPDVARTTVLYRSNNCLGI